MAAKSDDINQKVEEQTGFGSYVAKDLLSTGSVLAGIAVGGGLGFAASRSTSVVNGIKGALQWATRRINPEMADELTKDLTKDPNLAQKIAATVLAGGGAIAGSFLAAIPHTYMHWREQKKQQLRVEEMADDIITLRKQRNAVMTDLSKQTTTIKEQNTAIQKILEQGPKKQESIMQDQPKGRVDRLALEEQQQSAEPNRG